jgi:site-specific recombinase XerD
MSANILKAPLQSILATVIMQFIQEKKACGYQYNEEIRQLRLFDLYLLDEALTRVELPRTTVRNWLTKRPHESPRTHQHRASIVRQLAEFMVRQDLFAYIPEKGTTDKCSISFMPHVLSHAEVQRLFYAVDNLHPTARSPLRHIVMPEIFRLLYNCGFRVNEVLKLRIQDVDLNQGIITVRQGKFGKDRMVPPALPIIKRLRIFDTYMKKENKRDFFFTTLNGSAWGHRSVYLMFRELLLACGIPHSGRGGGPRVHDLRHTFAVHALIRWYRVGADIDAKLPLLAAYMGHRDVSGTQQYLHLTAELFPEINKRTNSDFNDVIPTEI